jgi:hypothetical protein
MKSRKGYGRFLPEGRFGRSITATHFAWQLANGPVPDGMMICHTCDNPRCVRADHLFLGTAADNSADMVSKGRQPSGTANPNAIFTDEEVIEVRRRYAAREATLVELAREKNACRGTISMIVSGRTWRHLLP